MRDSELQWNDELIAGCKRRDRQSQSKLYHLYSNAMYNTAYRIVGNSHDAEDVLVSSFTDVFRAIDSYDRRATPGAWIKRIVVNRAITTLNKRKHQMELAVDVPDVEDEVHEECDRTYDIEIIKSCIGQLAEGYRTVLNLYLIEGYDHTEIAQILDISVATSKSQYSRAKRKLRELVYHSKE